MYTNQRSLPTLFEMSERQDGQMIPAVIPGVFVIIAFAIFILKCTSTVFNCCEMKKRKDIKQIPASGKKLKCLNGAKGDEADEENTSESQSITDNADCNSVREMMAISEQLMIQLQGRDSVRKRLEQQREMQKLREIFKEQDLKIKNHLTLLEAERVEIKEAMDIYGETVNNIHYAGAHQKLINELAKLSDNGQDQSFDQSGSISKDTASQTGSIETSSSDDNSSEREFRRFLQI